MAFIRLKLTAMYRLRVVPFVVDMASLYRDATLVVSPAGGVTCAELLTTGTPSFLIAAAHAADDHQSFNARSMVELGNPCIPFRAPHPLRIRNSVVALKAVARPSAANAFVAVIQEQTHKEHGRAHEPILLPVTA